MVKMQVHSIFAGNINADLISGPSLSLDGFGIDLPPQGKELQKRDSNRRTDYVDELYKLNQHGGRTNQLPCHFEPNRKRWTMAMVMSADEDTSNRLCRSNARQIHLQTYS
jgi:hypothetical protein